MLIKRLIIEFLKFCGIYSYLVKTKFWFKYNKKKHYEKYGRPKGNSSNSDILSKIYDKGILKMDNYFNPDLIDNLESESKSLLDLLKKQVQYFDDVKTLLNPNNKFVKNHPKFGDIFFSSSNIRISNCKEIIPNSEIFFKDTFINEIANQYLGGDGRLIDSYIDYKYDISPPGVLNLDYLPHADHWRRRFKIFLFLDNVTKKNGPLCYLEKSHFNLDWKIDFEYDYYRSDLSNNYLTRYLNITPSEFYKIKKVHKLNLQTSLCNKGDIFFVDTNGFHFGTPIYEGKRTSLVLNYGI